MSQLTPGKVALVTGGGSGIGRATCEVLAREGARVIAADINETGAKETVASLPGHDHLAIYLDVTKLESIKSVVTNILKKYNTPPNIVINCAGIVEIHSVLDETELIFQKIIDTNLKSAFLVTQQVCKELISRKLPGSIVNIVSMVGHRGYPGFLSYAASKLGLEGMTRCIAKDMSEYNIRCNAVQPGMISSPMGNQADDKAKEEWCKGLATKRMGTPEEVAEVIVFVASDRNSYVNGAIIPVTGGM